MTHMQMGNTYISHVILVFWFFGMYLRLCSGDYGKNERSACGYFMYFWQLSVECPVCAIC